MIIFDHFSIYLPHGLYPSKPLSLTLPTPTCTLLIGGNGSGKTTFVKTLLGLRKPYLGFVKYTTSTRIGYVPQLIEINPVFQTPVMRFLELAIPYGLKKPDWFDERVQHLAQVWGLDSYLKRPIQQLSLGQKARVLIVRALLMKPNILVMDEPLASLDVAGQILLRRTIQELVHDKQTWIFLIEHHQENWLETHCHALYFTPKEDHLDIYFKPYVH